MDMRRKEGDFFERIPEEIGKPQFEWRGRLVKLVVCENEEEIPIDLVVKGSFFGSLVRDGMFVEEVDEGLKVYDCRLIFGEEVQEELPQEFVTRILERRLEG
jgi:hypothetical protein